MRTATLGALIAAVALSGCSGALVDPGGCAAPVVSRASASTDSTNVLRAFVSAEVHGADSVAVRVAGGTTTPAIALDADTVLAPILGLESARTYSAQLVAYSACGATTSDTLTFTTGTLPADLPSYTADGPDPAPGFVVFAAGRYGIVVDNTGRVVWYHRFPDGPGLNFQAQPDGRYAARPPTPANVPGAFVEIDPSGRVVRTLGCARGLSPRMHDMIAQPDGTYWLMCDEIRTLDLSAQGGSAGARVLGGGVQHLSAAGDVLFDWRPFDHLTVQLGILDPVDRDAAVVNWTHTNSLDLDAGGNLLLSFRNLNELMMIDTRTGDVRWRLGGTDNQFAVENGETPPFLHQHGVRAIGVNEVQLLDNLGAANGSRAERYEIDDLDHIASLRLAYRSAAGIVAQIGGSTQTLAGGHTLVSYGSGAGVEEYDLSGSVAWRLTGKTGYVFRAQRIRSLYAPGVGDPR
jgi:Arylsulfotransferase (ASST)